MDQDQYLDEIELEHLNDDDEDCRLVPEESFRKKGQVVEKLYAVTGSNPLKLVDGILKTRSQKLDEDIDRSGVECRLGCDFGQGMTKIVLSLVIPEFKELASSDSHKNTFTLATMKAGESKESITALWKMSGAEKLFSKYKVKFVTDLKLYSIMFSLNSCRCKQPCIICFWKGTLNKDETRDGCSVYNAAALRGDYSE